MNCAVEYDDVAEARITHPDLLPGEESSKFLTRENTQAALSKGKVKQRGETTERLAPASKPQPHVHIIVLSDERIARARLWLLRNTKWGESVMKSGNAPWTPKQ